MTTTDRPQDANDRTQRSSNAYAWAVVFLLMLAYGLSFVDRMVINLLVDPIKSDLDISDTQMSLLMGFSFAIFYTTMGIPIARLADRYNRKHIIMCAVTCWSVMTALCGFANSFLALFGARIGVGAGEGGLSPAAYSIIADYFPRKKIGRAISVYSMGMNAGIGLAFIISASLFTAFTESNGVSLPLLEGLKPWQLTFIVVALPGLVIVPLLLLIREPIRKRSTTTSSSSANAESPYAGIMEFIKRRKVVVSTHLIGFSLFAIVDYAFLSWIPTYYFRVRGVGLETTGVNFGMAYMFFGVAGIYLGAKLSEMLHARKHYDGIFRISAYAALLLIPTVWLIISLPGKWSYVAMAVYILLYSVPWGIAAAAIQLFTPNQFRAQLSAIYLMAVSLTGLIVGPSGVALLTDYYFHDEMQVGMSIAIVCTVCLVGSGAALLVGRRAYGEAVLAEEVAEEAEPEAS